VLDLGGAEAALATRILGDLGAEVVLCEGPDGSRTRRLAPFLDDRPGLERGYRHLYLNAGKRSVLVDESASGSAIDTLARSAELVVVTTERSDELPPLVRRLLVANPSLIAVVVSPFGPAAGERASWRSSDLVAQASAGLLAVSGDPRDPPTRGPAQLAFALASLSAAAGAMLSLTGVRRGRGGGRVDVSLQGAVTFSLIQTSNPNTLTWRDEVPKRPGLSNAVLCADGKWAGVNVLATRLPEFIALLDSAGVEHDFEGDDWQVVHRGARPVWRALDNPLQHAAARLAAKLPRDEFLRQMWSMESAALPTLTFPEMAEAEHYRANDQFRSIRHEPLGVDLSFVRSPVDAVNGGRLPERAPALGEHAAILDEPARDVAPVVAPSPPQGRPLEGLRVIDLCWVLAGPLATRILANFGAEVIKVESASRPDALRNAPQPDGRYAPDIADVMNDANTSKRSLLLNLSTEEGRALLLELVAESDIVVDNYRAHALDRMGFPYERLREVNPGIIVAHMPGPGLVGPWADYRTLGNLLMAASGLNFLMGFEGREPRGVGIAYPDFTSPLLTVVEVLAALRERDATGVGREIQMGQLSATVSLLGAEWMRYARDGEQPPRPGNRDPNMSPHGVFPVAGEDRWIAIAVQSEQEWQALAGVIGRPELASDPRFATLEDRRAHEDELEALLAEWTVPHDGWELAERLQREGIAACPVEDLRDMMTRDAVLAEHYQTVRQPSDPSVEITIDRDPIWMEGQPRELERAPMMGEHSEYVIRSILGRSREDFDRLVVAGVVG
jgi:crotonobetainyl-CoA:carnitine CoA-transferase CaiB-like acyl-CoA transferase